MYETGARKKLVTVLFHNLKGFDGVFLLKELYRVSRRVENQACMGVKVLTPRKRCSPEQTRA